MIDLAIIGVQKAGTSALFGYLKQHEGVYGHISKEFPVFLHSDYDETKLNDYLNEFYPKDIFSSNKKVIMKSVGILEMPNALQRLKKINPQIKLVVVLRDPVDRAYSSFLYAQSKGFEEETHFSKAIRERNRYPDDDFKNRNCNYVEKGFYFKNLQELEVLFPISQIKVIDYRLFRKHAQKTVNDIWTWLNLQPVQIEEKIVNKTGTVRNKGITKIIRKKSFLKRMIKSWLPVSVRMSVKQSIEKFNQQPILNKPSIEETDRLYLEEAYQNELDLLKIHYNIDFKTSIVNI